MAIDNGFNFNRDDVYNDMNYANVGGAFEVALNHPELVAEYISSTDVNAHFVEFVQKADDGKTYTASISSKRDVVWFQYPGGAERRVEIPTGKILLHEILDFIEEIEFGS